MFEYVFAQHCGLSLTQCGIERFLSGLVENGTITPEFRDYIMSRSLFGEVDTFVPFLHMILRWTPLVRRVCIENPHQGKLDLTSVYTRATVECGSDNVNLLVSSPPGTGKTKGLLDLLMHVHSRADPVRRGPFAVFFTITVEMARVMRQSLANATFDVVVYSDTSRGELLARSDRYVLISTIHSLCKMFGPEMPEHADDAEIINRVFASALFARLPRPPNLDRVHFTLGDVDLFCIDESHTVLDFVYGDVMHGIDVAMKQTVRNCVFALMKRARIVVMMDAGIPLQGLTLECLPNKESTYTVVTTAGPEAAGFAKRRCCITSFKSAAATIAQLVQMQKSFMIQLDNREVAETIADALTAHSDSNGDDYVVRLLTSRTCPRLRDHYITNEIPRKFGNERPVEHRIRGVPQRRFHSPADAESERGVSMQRVVAWCNGGERFCTQVTGSAWCGGEIHMGQCALCGSYDMDVDELGFVTAREIIVTTTMTRGTSLVDVNGLFLSVILVYGAWPPCEAAQALFRIRNPMNPPLYALSDGTKAKESDADVPEVLAKSIAHYWSDFWQTLDQTVLARISDAHRDQLAQEEFARMCGRQQSNESRPLVDSMSSVFATALNVPGFVRWALVHSELHRQRTNYRAALTSMLTLWSCEFVSEGDYTQLDNRHGALLKKLMRVILRGGEHDTLKACIEEAKRTLDVPLFMKNAGLTGDPALISNDDGLEDVLSLSGLHTGAGFSPGVCHHLLHAAAVDAGDRTRLRRVDRLYATALPPLDDLCYHTMACRNAINMHARRRLFGIRDMLERESSVMAHDFPSNPFFEPLVVTAVRKKDPIPHTVADSIRDGLGEIHVLCNRNTQVDAIITHGDVFTIMTSLIVAWLGNGAEALLQLRELRRPPGLAIVSPLSAVDVNLQLEASRLKNRDFIWFDEFVRTKFSVQKRFEQFAPVG